MTFFTLFQSLRLIVDHIDDSPSFPLQQYQTHHDATSHNTDKHPSSYCPTICSVSIDPRFLHGSRMHSDFTRRCSLSQCTAAKAREAREMHSVSIVSFGAELGWPSIRLMFKSSHNITKRFSSRCFVIKSAGLTVPRIFSILRSWFFSLSLLQPKVLRFHMLDCAAPASESQSARCCICPDSHLSFVSKLSYRVGQSDGLTCTAYHAVVF